MNEFISRTREWIGSTVIGLNLCPFARRVFDAGLIRFAVSGATTEEQLLDDLRNELERLLAAPRSEIETAILIHPHVLMDFLDYNDFLAEADRLLRRMKLDGVVQIASFHPRYQFEGTEPDAPENGTNRSPFPMLHLLREISITEVADDPEVLLGIPDRNIATMRRLARNVKPTPPVEPPP
ncbi:MAG: DUF1415 domain-containing protein [Gemmataceae bacterium]